MTRNSYKHTVLLKKRGLLRRKSFRRLFLYIGVVYRLSKGQQIGNKYTRHFYKNYFILLKQLGVFFKKTLFYKIFLYKLAYSPVIFLSSLSTKNFKTYAPLFYRLTTSNRECGSLVNPLTTSQIFWIKGWKFINATPLTFHQASALIESTNTTINILFLRGLWVRSGFATELGHCNYNDHPLASFNYEYNLFAYTHYYTLCWYLFLLRVL